MAIVRRQYSFGGRVQGVGFRYSAQHIAQTLGVTGWVRNEWDRTVTMEVQGPEEEIGRLVAKLRSIRFIRIDRMGVLELPVKEERGFHVR